VRSLAILLLLASPALAADPDTLTAEDKALYLKCAYAIGGSSVTLRGSIDLSDWSREELQKCIDPQPFAEAVPPKPVKTVAVAPDAEKPAPESNVCTRKGLRKIMTRGGRSWRCRK
jgi:DNA replication initiation complex subunit (GINS family)